MQESAGLRGSDHFTDLAAAPNLCQMLSMVSCVEEEAHACAWPWSKCPAPPRRGGPALPNTSLGAMDEARGGAEQQLPDGGVQVHRLECHGSASF